ncbi:MAG: prolyl oligopeptidase family serine peptidase [Streptosporangiales bacterium]|nr:prolyl oligopeptidase family serine peptidase [Streptosporangiales bacterium]
MPHFDLGLDELRAYRSKVERPGDFDAFWSASLQSVRGHPIDVSWTPHDTGLRLLDTFDVRFAGWDGQPVHGWLHVPAGAAVPLPVVVQYIGYGSGRGLAHQNTLWAQAGYAHFVMDTRGQGSAGTPGDTGDPEPSGANAHHPGFMTRGILDRETYYYRRVFVDAVRAVDAVGEHPAVDVANVVVTGGSQGGGITLAVAALRNDVRAALPDVPFLCDFRRAVELVDSDPYAEIRRYLKVHRDHVDRVFRTLAYFDGVNLAPAATAPALFSVGLMDEICPPSTVFAAYNAYGGPRDIEVYPYNEHEGGEAFHEVKKLAFVREVLGR